MTPEQHQAEHVRLHRAVDELLACYLTETRRDSGRGSVHNTILQLLTWSHEKTMQPSDVTNCQHDTRDAGDLESQRQMIVLALAELALSRPGFEEAIRDIARFYDNEELTLFDCFKQNNADRVRESHGNLGPALRAKPA
jgi:hypothetical protein